MNFNNSIQALCILMSRIIYKRLDVFHKLIFMKFGKEIKVFNNNNNNNSNNNNNNEFAPNLLQNWGMYELLLNPHFAPELEHLVINDIRAYDFNDNLFKNHLLSFADTLIQPSTGGNAVKRKELIKDIIVLWSTCHFPGADNSKVSISLASSLD